MRTLPFLMALVLVSPVLADEALKAYQARLREAPPATAAAHVALAEWCLARSLPAEARRHHEAALALNPECEPACIALGYVKVAGIWMSPQDRLAVDAASAASDPDVADAEVVGKGDGGGLLVKLEKQGVLKGARYARISQPLVRIDLRMTMGQLMSMRNVPAVPVPGGGALNLEAPIVKLDSVRTSVQAAGAP